jgi:hypothetical protein
LQWDPKVTNLRSLYNVGDKRVADHRSFSPFIIYHPQ